MSYFIVRVGWGDIIMYKIFLELFHQAYSICASGYEKIVW